MKEFYLEVTSESGTTEFPDNKANHFKNRLPYPLQFRESGWKVGLTSISHPVPPLHAHQTIDFPAGDILFELIWSRGGNGAYEWGRPAFIYKRHLTSVTGQDLKNDRNLVSTEKWLMKYIQHKVNTALNLMEKEKDTLFASDGKNFFPELRWEGDEFVIDKSDTFLNQTGNQDGDQMRPVVKIKRELAEKMGWILIEPIGDHLLTQNLIKEFPTHKVPDGVQKDWQSSDDVRGGGWSNFWLLTDSVLQLGPYCNWRFTYLDESYKKAFGGNVTTLVPHRSPMFVYSNVGQSTVAADQVTDLLREIPVDPTVMTYEPVNPLYLPVRTDVMDIIKVLLTEHNGELVDFVRGVTRLTLHFKYE